MKLLFHGIGVYRKGKPFGRVCWPHHDLLILKEGEAVFESAGGTMNLQAGDAVWIPPRLYFKGSAVSERCAMWVTHFHSKKLKPSDYTTHREIGVGVFRGGARLPLAGELMDVMHRLYRGSNQWQDRAADYLGALLAELSRHRYPAGESDEPWLRSLELWAQENLDAGIGVRELAERANLSESYFRKLFREREGLSVGRYLHELRLKVAKALLRESALSLKEIGAQVGYSDTAAFHRAFMMRYKVTPGAFRKTIRPAI